MLRFQTPPDKIFMAILEDSIMLMIDQIKAIRLSGEDKDAERCEFESLLPFAGRVFNYETALNTLKRMITCHKSPGLYHLNDYHYLLLYDTLQYYCEIRNDMVRTSDDLQEKEKLTVIRGVHIEVINFDDLIAIYFFDMDFLLDTETVIGLGLDKRTLLGIHNETFGISQGLAPHPEELKLAADDYGRYDPVEQPQLWSGSSKIYPHMQTTD